MITNAQYIIYPLLLIYNGENYHCCDHYKSYTTTSMIKNDSLEFYENFWESLIKEDCDSNSMVE